MSEQRSYDAIVLGLGAMGSATLFHLARAGASVLGLEQYAQGHTLGSSHGDSRIIRETYFEHPLYVPLVRRAHELWRELEELSGTSLMQVNGGLMIGPRDGSVIAGTLRSAREHQLPHEILTREEVSNRYPVFDIAPELIAVFDPRAGYLDADACNKAHIDAAKASGATACFEESVLEWRATADSVMVRTRSGSYSAARLVLTAGPWTASLLGNLALPLEIERQSVFWLEPPRAADYDPARFPIYAYEYTPGHICYGFPRLARGAKASVMHSGEISDRPERIKREVTDDEIEPLRGALRPVLPELASAPVRDGTTCLFTNTPDHDFIIDWHPAHANVLISSPCSGHGFKFASAVGELQSELLTDRPTRFDLRPFRVSRFAV